MKKVLIVSILLNTMIVISTCSSQVVNDVQSSLISLYGEWVSVEYGLLLNALKSPYKVGKRSLAYPSLLLVSADIEEKGVNIINFISGMNDGVLCYVEQYYTSKNNKSKVMTFTNCDSIILTTDSRSGEQYLTINNFKKPTAYRYIGKEDSSVSAIQRYVNHLLLSGKYINARSDTLEFKPDGTLYVNNQVSKKYEINLSTAFYECDYIRIFDPTNPSDKNGFAFKITKSEVLLFDSYENQDKIYANRHIKDVLKRIQ